MDWRKRQDIYALNIQRGRAFGSGEAVILVQYDGENRRKIPGSGEKCEKQPFIPKKAS